MKRSLPILVLVLLALAIFAVQPVYGDNNSKATIGINVVLNTDITSTILTDLGKYGKVRDVVYEIRAVTVVGSSTVLPQIQALPYVLAAGPDAARDGGPVDTIAITDFSGGFDTWNLDAVNVTAGPLNPSRAVRGITYVADLKAGDLAGSPVVISMSLGGSALDPMEQAAIDYAISKGVIIVAAAGNNGALGMHYPGAYAPVISVAASGWIGEWLGGSSWWLLGDVAEPTSANDFYVTTFSGRQLPGQDLDVAAPGSWVVGPYQKNSGQINYYFLGGTSMATPHVSGIVALMAQKFPALTAADAETILETSAIPIAPGCRDVPQPDGSLTSTCWLSDATGAGLATADAALAATP